MVGEWRIHRIKHGKDLESDRSLFFGGEDGKDGLGGM